jgi:hypothetical protein
MSNEEVWSSTMTVWPVFVPLFGVSSRLFPLAMVIKGMKFLGPGVKNETDLKEHHIGS